MILLFKDRYKRECTSRHLGELCKVDATRIQDPRDFFRLPTIPKLPNYILCFKP